MILARCPACQTVFRVRPEHLRAHQGAVRCGQCFTPFDALANLVDEDVAAPAPAPSSASQLGAPAPSARSGAGFGAQADETTAEPAVTADRAPSPPDEPPASVVETVGNIPESFQGEHQPTDEAGASEAPRPIGNEPTIDGLPGGLEFEIPDRFLGPDRGAGAPSGAVSEQETQPGARPAVSADNPFDPASLDFVELPAPPIRRRSAQPPDAEPAPAGAAATEEGTERPQAPQAQDNEQTSSAGAPLAPEPDEPLPAEPPEMPALWVTEPSTDTLPEDEPAPTSTEAVADSAESRVAPSPSPARRGWLALGVGLLLGVLAVQTAYLFRAEITREWPQLRPAFLAACERLGCTIALPRFAGAISIEASDLQSEPGPNNRFVLDATVRNRAAHVQAFPHLELTLTDAQDRPLVRRVFPPEEWTGRDALADGFAAGEDVSVRLPFAAPGIDAAGYRLYVFYP